MNRVRLYFTSLSSLANFENDNRIRPFDMYHFFVKKLASWAFHQLSQQNSKALLDKCSPHIHHHFAGDHALGGERHTKEAFEAWLGRLFRLFPDLQFKLDDIIVSGMPWNTRVAIVWKDEGHAVDGVPYVNEGVHILKLKWGKLHALYARLDTQLLEQTMNRMMNAGIEEAGAKPIEDGTKS